MGRVLNRSAAVIGVSRRCRWYFGRFATTLDLRLFQQNRPPADERHRSKNRSKKGVWLCSQLYRASGIYIVEADRQPLFSQLRRLCRPPRTVRKPASRAGEYQDIALALHAVWCLAAGSSSHWADATLCRIIFFPVTSLSFWQFLVPWFRASVATPRD